MDTRLSVQLQCHSIYYISCSRESYLSQMGSVVCIKPEILTTLKPCSQSWFNTSGEVEWQIESFYHNSHQQNHPSALAHRCLEIWQILCWSIANFCVWSVFRTFNIVKTSQKIVRCFGDMADFVLVNWKLLCLEHFQNFLHSEDKSENCRKNQYGNSITSSLTYVVEDS